MISIATQIPLCPKGGQGGISCFRGGSPVQWITDLEFWTSLAFAGRPPFNGIAPYSIEPVFFRKSLSIPMALAVAASLAAALSHCFIATWIIFFWSSGGRVRTETL